MDVLSARSQDIAFTLVVGEQDYPIGSLGRLHDLLSAIKKETYSELWLEKTTGEALCMLKSHDQAWLMFLRHRDGDSGFSSRNPDYRGPAAATLEFYLSNGQRDEYPASWCLHIEDALRAIEHFFMQGEKPAWVQWHED